MSKPGTTSFAAAVHAKAAHLARLIVEMTTEAGSGHPSSALSLVHIVVALMYRYMRYDPADPWNRHADRLVLSEGHAVPVVYAAYADLGGVVGRSPADARPLTLEDLRGLRAADSVLDGHPNPAEGFPFFDAATGSLGQGLSVAAGLALQDRLDGVDRRIYALLGDGEAREGQVWEAVDFIAERGLTSVVAVFNCNGQGQAGDVSPQQSPEILSRRLRAAGWAVTVIDGHDPDQIASALATVVESEAPVALVARTVKGWGVRRLQEGNWHGKPLPRAHLAEALADLEAIAREQADAPPLQTRPAPSGAARASVHQPVSLPPIEEALDRAGFGDAWQQRRLATRRAYGAALRALGEVDPAVVVLDADVSNSTFTEVFAARFPERFVECRIAEQNMVSVGVGMAAAGAVPFVNSFAKFLVRAYDQVEMAAITRANIKLVGSHAGVSLAADGPSQMECSDVAFFRSLAHVDNGFGAPACIVFHPADAVAAYRCTELMANHVGMCYMRTHRPDTPVIYPPDARFEVGGWHVLRDGSDMVIAAAGFMVSVVLGIVDRLAEQGLRCTLVDGYGFPLRTADLLDLIARRGGRCLVVEDNYVGGLYSELAEAAASRPDVAVHGMTYARIPKSARTAGEVLAMGGLAEQAIVDRVRALASGHGGPDETAV